MFVYAATSPSRVHISLLKENDQQNFLFSYAFIKNPRKLIELLGDPLPRRIILDSGAFSVWTNGGTVSLTDYGKFATEIQELLPGTTELNIVNLDVLPGKWGLVPSKEEIADSAEKGWQNMLYLESLGLKVIHVYHQHEDFAVLDRLRGHSDYIGVSPANDVSMKEKLAWMDKVYERLDVKNTKIKTHGFAVTGHKQLYNYPFYSVDSSSWVMSARFGRLAIFTDKKEIKTFAYKDINGSEMFWKYISHLGMERIASDSWHDRTSISIKSYQKLQDFATKLWTNRGIIFN